VSIGVEKSRRALQFAGDLVLSIGATIAITSVLNGLLQLRWSILLFPLIPLFPFIPLLVYGGPISVAVYGLWHVRPGFIIGPILLSALYYFSNVEIKQQHEDRIAAFATATLEAPQHPHAVLAIIDGLPRCNDQCRPALASGRTWAVSRAGQPEWVVFRAGTGADCLRPENVEDTLDFLRSGYANLCAIRTGEAGPDDALVYEQRAIRPEKPDPDLPNTMTGTVFEIRERLGGRDRLLGRRVEGLVKSALPDAYGAYTSRARQVDAGPRIDLNTFTAGALGVSVNDIDGRGPAPLGELLDAIESLFDVPGLLGKTASMWGVTASSQGRNELDVIRPRIERLLDSNEIERTGAALSGLFAVVPAERGFARDRLIALAFGPFVAAKDGAVRVPLLQHLKTMPGPFPPAARARAKARLADPGLTDGERQAMFMILLGGGPDEQREAVELLFSLAALPFERTVAAMAQAREARERWSPADLDRLIERMSQVPTSRLHDYLSAFWAVTSKEQRLRLIEELRARLEGDNDDNAVRSLNEWIRVLGH
jgi:hypothetical protein